MSLNDSKYRVSFAEYLKVSKIFHILSFFSFLNVVMVHETYVTSTILQILFFW